MLYALQCASLVCDNMADIFFPQNKKLSSPLSLANTTFLFLLSFDFVFFFVIKHTYKNRFAFKKTNKQKHTHTYTPLYLYTSFFCDKL